MDKLVLKIINEKRIITMLRCFLSGDTKQKQGKNKKIKHMPVDVEITLI